MARRNGAQQLLQVLVQARKHFHVLQFFHGLGFAKHFSRHVAVESYIGVRKVTLCAKRARGVGIEQKHVALLESFAEKTNLALQHKHEHVLHKVHVQKGHARFLGVYAHANTHDFVGKRLLKNNRKFLISHRLFRSKTHFLWALCS